MKRKSFLQRIMAGVSLLAAPIAIIAKQRSAARTPKAFKVAAGKDRFGKTISLFEGDTFSCN